MRYALSAPERLNVIGPGGEVTVGGSQEWYADHWHRLAGCGPTSAANILWYLARSGRRVPCETGDGGRDDFLALMDEMFTFVTPGVRGVNSSAIFTGGIAGYAEKHGVAIDSHVLEIPGRPLRRPGANEVYDFVRAAISNDTPLAFLNLSNGTLVNLDNWHWVTVIGMDGDSMAADISDQGRVLTIDLAEWLRTSVLGGALVYLTVQ